MPKAKKKTIGRPAVMNLDDVVYITGKDARSFLQPTSERKALIDRIIEMGGRAIVKKVNESFGYDTRTSLIALSRNGWLGFEPQSQFEGSLPRISKQKANLLRLETEAC